jgi:hypothetical protein
MTTAPFAQMLRGGHPNSLGRAVEVVDIVLADNMRLEELYACYFDDDEVVRLRVSNAFKRIWREDKMLVVPYVDRFISEISAIEQASTQWTMAQLFDELRDYLTAEQTQNAINILKRNLTAWEDWIVLNNTMQALTQWAKKDADLRAWLMPILQERAEDSRKSVAKTANKCLKQLSNL